MPNKTANFQVASIGYFLKGLFQKFAELGVIYAVLRNYEGLPAVIGHDVDFFVKNKI